MRIINNYLLAKFLAFKRRLYILLFGEFNPYPDNPKKFSFSPSEFNQYEANILNAKLDLNSENLDLAQWKISSKKKLCNLLSIKNNLYLKLVHQINMSIKDGYERKRIYLEFSKARHAPIDIIRKKNIDTFKGIIFCMQGTNSGAHLNLGEIRMPADVAKVYSGSDLAIQAANEGYLAVSYERIGFGERREQILYSANNSPIIDASFHSLLLGNTLLGENVKEIILIINWLKNKYENKDIWLVGYSAAGTTAIAAAAIDENIDGIAVGGCVGLSNETILKRAASGYNDIPNMLEWFDLDAQIALIAPRPCIIIAGVNDHIWPYKAALNTVKNSKKLYANDSAEENLVLIKASGGHTYYPNLMWTEILKFFN